MGFSITEEDIAKPQPKMEPFGPGNYEFEFTDSEYRTSEKGRRYTRLKLGIKYGNRTIIILHAIYA